MCKLLLTTACAFLLLQPGSLLANESSGADDKISFNAPSADRFTALKTAPPILGRWQAKDGRMNFVIKQKALQPNMKPSQSDLEKEFLGEINSTMTNGKLIDSTMKRHDGYDLFTLTGQGNNGNTTIYFTRKIIAADEKNYLLIAIAVGIGIDIRANVDAIDFIGSVKWITSTQKQADRIATSAPIRASENLNDQQPQQVDSVRVGYIVARVVFLILVLAVGGARTFRGSQPKENEKTGNPKRSW